MWYDPSEHLPPKPELVIANIRLEDESTWLCVVRFDASIGWLTQSGELANGHVLFWREFNFELANMKAQCANIICL